MPKIVKDYPDTENLKNKFVLDEIAEDDPDLEKLNELAKIKLAIQRQKKSLKEKNFAKKHPEIAKLKAEVSLKKQATKPEPAPEPTPEPEPAPTKAAPAKEPAKPTATAKIQQKAPSPAKSQESDFNKAISNMRGDSHKTNGKTIAKSDGSWLF
jgi:outer membrane biosynthesis protein TonB